MKRLILFSFILLLAGGGRALSAQTAALPASENHLRAFTRNLKACGVDYSPAVLPAADFDRIVAGTTDTPDAAPVKDNGKKAGVACCGRGPCAQSKPKQ